MKNKKIEDPHSFAQPELAKMNHLELDIKVDFEAKKIKGKAKIFFEHTKQGQLFLDTRGLIIEKVTVGDREVDFTLHDEIDILGSALEIKIDSFAESVNILYETSENAPALQWLSPKQTAGKLHPFLFTQSQAILARTWIPCQDSPGIRFTYNAKISVPKGLTALMSAETVGEDKSNGEFYFEMKQPIPAYLMALAVGNVQFKEIGERTGVYAEPITLPKAAKEFEDMESMLVAAEGLYGKYAWDRYDVLVLPPSFPFGGMENPRLTFATPTILAGDKSLVSLIAHELAHSWSGNLVTNATWNDFWLNEGFTVYFEYRIMEEIYGKEFYEMLALISYDDLQNEIEAMNFSADTHLKLNLAGRDPDEGLTSIAYDKGFFMLKLLEEKVGKENWDKFLVKYFNEYKFKSIDTESFINYLNSNLLDTIDNIENELLLEKWIYGPGLPENCPKIESSNFRKVEHAATEFIDSGKTNLIDMGRWTYQENVKFLRLLSGQISKNDLAILDSKFNLTNSTNNEVLFEWLILCIEYEYSNANGKLKTFLQNVGRRKFVAPLYKKLIEKNQKAFAQEIYSKSKENYHYVTSSTIDSYFKK